MTAKVCFLASFSAAGIFFCFLVKEKAPDLMGEADVEAQRLPKRNKTSSVISAVVKYTDVAVRDTGVYILIYIKQAWCN